VILPGSTPAFGWDFVGGIDWNLSAKVRCSIRRSLGIKDDLSGQEQFLGPLKHPIEHGLGQLSREGILLAWMERGQESQRCGELNFDAM
jgi:hypothetical protein